MAYTGKTNLIGSSADGDDNKNGVKATVEGGSGGMLPKGNSKSLRNIPTTSAATNKDSNPTKKV